VATFGQEIVGPDGCIDRRALGAKVFGRPDEMKKLTTAIGNIRQAVKGVIEAWNAALAHTDVAILEAVNLFEAGYGAWCQQTWLVACTEDIARRRLMARNGFTLAEANQRLASQRPWQKRAPAADLVLQNDSDYQEFANRVEAELAYVRDLWEHGQLPPSKYHDWWKEHRRVGG
jgi:dephospho-CoA kinase